MNFWLATGWTIFACVWFIVGDFTDALLLVMIAELHMIQHHLEHP